MHNGTHKSQPLVPLQIDRSLPFPCSRISTGVSGLDEILHGGLIPARTYLLRGGPGCGKTTLGLQFLLAGTANDERCLFITLGENEKTLRQNAAALGLDLAHVAFLDLSPEIDFFTKNQSYDIFSSADVERDPLTRHIVTTVEHLQPQRVFLDAMTQLRYLASDAFQFRKQTLSFLRFLIEQGATVLFTSEMSEQLPDEDLQFISDGVILLENRNRTRCLQVSKFRGSDFSIGPHSLRLTSHGMEVFPRLLPDEHHTSFAKETLSSGIPALDELLHGGIERGTINLLTGPTGVGKTTLGLQFMKEAAGRGERSVVFAFEEWQETMLQRCEAVNIPVRAMLKRGTLSLKKIEPLYYTPDEFAQQVRQEVERHQARIVMLDSIAGYRLSLSSEDLTMHLHALCKYLQNMGVAVLLINEVEMITGDFRATEIGVSYLADNIIFLRYLEVQGALRRTIGVLKKRLTSFESTMREIELTRYGISVGKPLTGLQGILTGHLQIITPDKEEQ
ncbi:recombinase RecA [Ktedonosporobacter rubrisoli]|uniref:non-specific serine/threonine protein kinase n=2 Tax=Ktedonosporobacter rubrisoli TaxID=2509675 RepID=A0A4P6K7G9_KTERU|nr:recombinase RecA [Ktedonosporobacter rubrisoli]